MYVCVCVRARVCSPSRVVCVAGTVGGGPVLVQRHSLMARDTPPSVGRELVGAPRRLAWYACLQLVCRVLGLCMARF